MAIVDRFGRFLAQHRNYLEISGDEDAKNRYWDLLLSTTLGG